MADQRLPIVDSDDGVWGDIIRQFLMKEHYNTDTNNAANGGHHKVTIRAGTTAAGTAPLKLTSGPLLSTPEAGAVEFLSDSLYFTQTTSTTRKRIAAYDDTGATGDIYYRASTGNLARLAPGSTGDILTIASGIPSWTASLVGKTINLGSNTLTGTTAQFNTALSDGIFVTQAATQALTNKTISGSNNTITNLNASSITSGALPMARIGVGDFENLAAGSDFETDFYPWSLGTGRTIADDQAHSGTYSYKFAAGAGGAGFTGGTIELKEGDQLYVELWVRRDASYNATDARIRLGAMPGNLNVANLFFRASDISEVDTWVKRSFVTNPYPAGTIGVAPSITMTGLTAGNLWIDDIVIRRVKAAELIPDLDTSKLTSGTLPVARGGTGATSLTGIVRGNGTGAFTAITAPSGAIVGTTDTQILTGKTFNLTSNTLSGTTAQFNAALSDNLFATQAGAETLTNKTISGSSNTLTAIALSSLSISGTATGSTFLRGDGTWATPSSGGDTSTNTATSVDSEVALFSGTTGKTLKRATGTGLAKLSAGVLSIATAGTDYSTSSASEILTNKTLTAPRFANNGIIADNNGNEQIVFTTTTSAVNEIGITNAAAGGAPRVAARGSETNIDLNLASKGTGSVLVNGFPIITGENTPSGQLITNSVPMSHPESSGFSPIPYLYNDIAYNLLRGGDVEVMQNGSPLTSGVNNLFSPDVSSMGITPTASTDVIIITVTLHAGMSYTNTWGIVMSDSYRAQDVTIELSSDGSAWTSIYSAMNATRGTHWRRQGGTATAITHVRFTLTNLSHATIFRISQLFAISYSSPLASGPLLSRGGGALYGTSAAAPTLTATGGDANINLNLVAKGTGRVQAGGATIPTINSADTLTNKTINLTNNTLTGTTAQFNAALSDNLFATQAGSETLANKTISGTNNTFTNIPQSAITNLSTTLGDKVDKTATANRVYATDGSGVSTSVAYSSSATAATVVYRTTGGVTSVGTPTADTHATTKLYVDDGLATKANTSHTHTATQISDSTATGRSVLTAVSAAAARTAIGAGTGDGDVTLNGAQTLTNKDLTGTGNNINASNLTIGTLPDARMSGTYSGFTHKIDGANSVFSTTSSGSSNTLGRTVYGLAEYRSSSATTTGAIVFFAPTSGQSIMMQLELSGLLYQQNVVDVVVQGYRSTTTSWNDTRKVSRGSVDVDARWATSPSGNNCLIIGDVDTVWNYPHFSITRAMFSHTSTTDAFCSGWTVGLVTDLSSYTNVSSVISNMPTVGNISGSATTLASSRTFQTNLASTSSVSFNGSANVTPGVTGTLGVANGGTGRATATTAYGLIAAGTSATGAQQTIAPGTSGQFLKSAGTSALASFASIVATDISNSTTVGRSVLTATDAAAARTAIGAGTGDGDVTLTGAQILTNKTLTTPVINGTPTGTGVATGTTASTLMLRDANGNSSVSALIQGLTNIPTAAGITTLTIASDGIQNFTGSSTQTVRLPTTSVPAGLRFTIINSSTGGAVTVQSSGSNTISTLPSGTSATFTSLVATPTSAAHWESTYINTGDTSTNTTTSVDSEVALFNGTTGKSLKRATGTGLATLTSGVLSVTAVPAGALVGTTAVQVLTGKTISLASNTLTATYAQLNTAVSDATLATTATTQTLTGKTMSGSSNTFTNIDATTALNATGTKSSTTFLSGDNTWATPPNTTYSEITSAEITAGTATTARAITGRRAQEIVDKAVAASGDVTLTGAQTLTNKTINLASNTLVGTIAQFNAALTGNLFATQAAAETLTNKTINLASNTLVGTTAQFNAALSDNLFATQAGVETLTNKRIAPRIVAITSSATPTINVTTTDQYNITALAANITSLSVTGTAYDGQRLMIRIKGAAARTITWSSSFTSSGMATLLTGTTAGKTHFIGFIYDAASAQWVCMAVDGAGY